VAEFIIRKEEDMSWTSEFNPELGIIETIFSVEMTGVEVREVTSFLISLGRKTGTTKFLVDASEIILVASIFDLYSLPAGQYVDEGADRSSCVALVIPRDEKAIEAFRFYETACRNRCWNVRLFQERQSAVNWLLGKTGSSKPDAGDG